MFGAHRLMRDEGRLDFTLRTPSTLWWERAETGPHLTFKITGNKDKSRWKGTSWGTGTHTRHEEDVTWNSGRGMEWMERSCLGGEINEGCMGWGAAKLQGPEQGSQSESRLLTPSLCLRFLIHKTGQKVVHPHRVRFQRLNVLIQAELLQCCPVDRKRSIIAGLQQR